MRSTRLHLFATWALSACLLGCTEDTASGSAGAELPTAAGDTAAGDTATGDDTSIGELDIEEPLADGTAGDDDATPDDAFTSNDTEAGPDDLGMSDGVDAPMPDLWVPNDLAEPEDAQAPDVAADDAGEPQDAGQAPDAGTPSAEGETCNDALDLRLISEPSGGIDYPYIVESSFGASDDYNPLIESGLPPACSLVYDAKGKDRVYFIDMEPGEELELKYLLSPAGNPGGLYILDSCDPVTWPDYDKSGKCGSNEYKSQGFCGPSGTCDPIEMSFLYPPNGVGTKRFWVVADEVADDSATGFVLTWVLHPAK